MELLALPLSRLKPRYDVVIVGSGYGGAVAASRLARAGRRVALLERGREFRPGDFPDTPVEAAGELRLHLDEGPALGPASALFDVHLGEEMHVVVGCGLGGTSLINAAVALRPDSRVFADPSWPAALRTDVDGGLEAGFQRAMAGLAAQPYPDDRSDPAKLTALKASAAALGRPCTRPPIAVSFAGERDCDGCGDCVAGCNRNAKNSTDTNYLPDARRHGAEIFCGARVSHLERTDAGWRVLFEPVEDGRAAFDAEPLAVEAEVVVLAAGTLGSSEILLRSREHGLPLSERVGSRFTGNGDALGFGYNLDVAVNGIGTGSRTAEPSVGPCITGVIDGRAADEPLGEGLVIEEGVLPAAMAPLLPAVFAAGATAFGRDTDDGLFDGARELGREAQSMLLGPYHGAVHHSQTYLVMGHDDAGGRLSLDDGRIRLRWPGVGEQPVFRRIDTALHDATAALGGTYIKNPLWSTVLGERLVTVHPLGGCPMGDDARTGAVDHAGQVFDGAGGLHRGLYVCDGAIMPRSLGCNPLLTITALAERNMALLAERHGWRIDYDGEGNAPAPVPAGPRLSFTETMRGHMALDAELDYRAAEAAGERLEFTVTIVADDLAAFLAAPGGTARLYGTVEAPRLSPQPLMVSGGTFRLFDRDPGSVGTRRMEYRMPLTAVDGSRYLLTGFKLIHDDGGLDLWADTTTLFVDLADEAGRCLGRGVLHIALGDFARQLSTLKVTGVDAVARLGWLARFGRLFAGTLFDVYGGIFARPNAFDPDAPPRKRRPLRAPLPEVIPLRASDGVRLRLTRFCGGTRGPVLLVHGLGNSSRVFTLDTVDTNLVEYLTAAGFDVWLLDSRASIELPAAAGEFDGDTIAHCDYPPAVRAVCEATGAESIDVVAHAFGALTMTAALLSGMGGVRSLVCAQVALHMEVPATVRLKAGLHIPALLDALGIDHLTAYTDSRADWLEELFNASLRLQPVDANEHCRSPVCHRVTFIYGQAFEHAQLNAVTHDTLHELFGTTSVRALEHLARIVRAGRLVDVHGNDRYLPHLERLAIPITLLHGTEDATLLPAGSERSLRLLSDRNGAALYRRHLLAGYGHLDWLIGARAGQEAFPYVIDHLARAAAGAASPAGVPDVLE